MTPAQGIETDGFGKWLTSLVATNPALAGYRVFYDHGDSALPNVAAIKGFYGTSVTNLNRLADVDVMVVGPDDQVVLLVEIEERECSPKKIIGDAATIGMCNRFAVGRGFLQQYFGVSPTTRLVISGVMPDRGNRIKKIDAVLGPRFQESPGFEYGVSPSLVDFVFEPDITALLTRLKAIASATLPG